MPPPTRGREQPPPTLPDARFKMQDVRSPARPEARNKEQGTKNSPRIVSPSGANLIVILSERSESKDLGGGSSAQNTRPPRFFDSALRASLRMTVGGVVVAQASRLQSRQVENQRTKIEDPPPAPGPGDRSRVEGGFRFLFFVLRSTEQPRRLHYKDAGQDPRTSHRVGGRQLSTFNFQLSTLNFRLPWAGATAAAPQAATAAHWVAGAQR